MALSVQEDSVIDTLEHMEYRVGLHTCQRSPKPSDQGSPTIVEWHQCKAFDRLHRTVFRVRLIRLVRSTMMHG